MKKKILKIVQIVYDILSLGFIVFVIVAMAVTPKSVGHHENNVTEVVETKTRDNFGYNDEYGQQSTIYLSDFLSSDFFMTLYDSIVKDNPNIAYDQSGSYNVRYLTFGVFYHLVNGNFSGDTALTTIRSILIERAYAIEYDNNSQVRYNIFLYSDTNFTTMKMVLSYWLNIPLLDGDFTHDMGVGVVNSVVNNNELGYSDFLVYYENTNEGYGFFTQKVILHKLQNQVDRYNEGYNVGYNRGYSIGLQTGDTAGYDRGFVDGAQGIETNAFTTLTQAFEAIGSIFSINVLPNLPLWVLVFAPLIVAVVIVIVKLIKG